MRSTNKQKSISVLMPVYNTGENILRQAIESILEQTFTDFEFIIINDASTNNAEEVILSYKDPRIKYLKNSRNLIIQTLNRGLDIATGKYIARLDSDDYSVPERLEVQFNYMENNPEIGLLGSFVKFIPENTEPYFPTNANDVMLTLRYCSNCITHSAAMIRKSVLDLHNLRYDTNCLHAEDHKLWSDMSRFCAIENLP